MRLNDKPSVSAIVRTSNVFAVPEAVIEQCPPTNNAISTCSSTRPGRR